MKQRLYLATLVAAALAFAISCGDDDNKGGTGGAKDSGAAADSGTAPGDAGTLDKEVSKLIKASAGGTVSTASGAAALEIPAGAPAKDTTITIKTASKSGQPDAANLGSNVFDIGPTGTAFSEPVTLTLKLDADVPGGKTAKIAVLSNGAWEAIDGSSVSDDEVSANIEHLSEYVILFVDQNVVVITPECADFTFSACGGDLTGSWNILTICLGGTIGANPFASIPECNNIVFETNQDYSGTIDFKSDGTYTMDISISAATMHVELTDACMQAYIKSSGQSACDIVARSIGTCAYASGVCKCDKAMDSSSDGGSRTTTDSGTYTVSGNALSMTSTADGGNETTEGQFCVSGNRGTFEVPNDQADAGVQMSYVILEKK